MILKEILTIEIKLIDQKVETRKNGKIRNNKIKTFVNNMLNTSNNFFNCKIIIFDFNSISIKRINIFKHVENIAIEKNIFFQ